MENWSMLFLDKSIDLLVTVIGFTLGAYVALYIAMFQINKQTDLEKKKNDEITLTLIDRCRIELRDNTHVLKNQLIPALELSQLPHQLHYEWILTIADSFKRTSYDDLLRLNLSHNMPKRVDGSLSTSFEMLEGLHSMIKVALAGFKFQELYKPKPDYSQVSYDNIKTYSQTVYKHVEYSLNEVNKFTESKKKAI